MRRKFACSLENADWADGWNGNKALGVQFLTRNKAGRGGSTVGKIHWLETHVAVQVSITESDAISLHVCRPTEKFNLHDGKEEIPVLPQRDDAKALVDTLIAILEKGGEAWEEANLVDWNTVRDEVVAALAEEESKSSRDTKPVATSPFVPVGDVIMAKKGEPNTDLLRVLCKDTRNNKHKDMQFKGILHAEIDWDNKEHIRKINRWCRNIYKKQAYRGSSRSGLGM
ncbi:hypothetical protein P171DRAFT_486946 [Karstenula rhodostoma CBS 690.94]|uniref:Uncharacterized protein n=1 Tax=Karstenula rhodostoma CBS 690.94 TaxID=1392251 RepID=A0A9P4UA92_9PLEO|nr:hypothetical protein P171DRAFT_486946 [Karstenula rhodostoma CBS 690.94]